DLIRELSKTFAREKIEEGIKRLIERRYVVPALTSCDSTVAGYWASLGLPAEIAEQNLANCRVRIEAIDVKGAPQLSSALTELGVNVVNRSPDLTITLVNDYFERRLAELNEQRAGDKMPWMLVQPSGVFPLVGPLLEPDQTACWTCLFDRMIRNREIKGFLDRRLAQPVAVSPLARNVFGQSAIQFAAVEIAKAVASGFRTDLRDHIASFDLLGATIVKHYVARRPQCPTCGSKKLQNPRRVPQPIENGPSAKLVMTSGGYRSVPSRVTVSRFRKHVSPLTGVVKRLEPIEADLPMNTNFFAQHNFSAPAHRGWRTSYPRPHRSHGEDRVVAGLVVTRPALQVSADRPDVLLLSRLPYRFQWLCGRQHAPGGDRPGLPRTRGARCLRDLVVQSFAAIGGRSRRIRRFLHPRHQDPIYRCGTQAMGARCHQRSRRSRLCRDHALDQRRPGEYRVWFWRAFRSPHCLAALADRAQPVPVDRPDGRRKRRQVEPRRHHAAAAGELSVPRPGKPSDRCAGTQHHCPAR